MRGRVERVDRWGVRLRVGRAEWEVVVRKSMGGDEVKIVLVQGGLSSVQLDASLYLKRQLSLRDGTFNC